MLERDEVLSWRLERWDRDRSNLRVQYWHVEIGECQSALPNIKTGYYCQTNGVATDIGLDTPPTTNQPMTTCLASVDGLAVATVSVLRETDRPSAQE